jgi:hypothetical protein
MATQQRTYQLPLDAAQQDEWIAWWRNLASPRSAYGFTIGTAVVDRDTGVFTWYVSHDGDFEAAEKAYYGSPERDAAFALPRPDITIVSVRMVERVQ